MRDFKEFISPDAKHRKITQDFWVCRRTIFCKNGEKDIVIVAMHIVRNDEEEE